MNYQKEYRTLTGKRIDYINFETKTIHELKPYNPAQIAKGKKKLEVYKKEMDNHPLHGGDWDTQLDTY